MTELAEYKRKPRKRSQKMPQVVENAVELLKAEERKALLNSIDNTDPAKAEMARVYAVAMDRAAQLVLHAFDEVSRKPQQ